MRVGLRMGGVRSVVGVLVCNAQLFHGRMQQRDAAFSEPSPVPLKRKIALKCSNLHPSFTVQ